MHNKRKIGNFGESIAKNYLLKKNYEILCTNFATSYGEIDIIAKDKAYVVFIEVKYRRSLSFGAPREAIINTKKEKITLAATAYIEQNNLTDTDFRFDVIEIFNKGKEVVIEHIVNAF